MVQQLVQCTIDKDCPEGNMHSAHRIFMPSKCSDISDKS
jgi:hypothetical protein